MPDLPPIQPATQTAPAEARLPEPGTHREGDLVASFALLVALALVVSLVSGVWSSARADSPVGAAAAAAAAPPLHRSALTAPGKLSGAPPRPGPRARPARRPSRVRAARRASATVSDAWVAGFLPLYQTAASTFSVNWLLLASVHRQETSFSTAPDTYTGLNFAGCCGGPMQFNVNNGPVSTWSLVANAYQRAARPAAYPHQTQDHPSIYDDFDAIMAAGRLISSGGAGPDLDASSWHAAYDYYGHDAAGVTYADQVLARAVSWAQSGFCPTCPLDPRLVASVHAAYAPGGSGASAPATGLPGSTAAPAGPPGARPPRPHARRRRARPHRARIHRPGAHPHRTRHLRSPSRAPGRPSPSGGTPARG